MPDPYILREPTKTRKGWRISCDTEAWMLEEGGLIGPTQQSGKPTNPKKVGTVQWKVVGWYDSIEAVLRGLLRIEARQRPGTLPEALSGAVHEVRGFLRELEQGLTIEVKL